MYIYIYIYDQYISQSTPPNRPPAGPTAHFWACVDARGVCGAAGAVCGLAHDLDAAVGGLQRGEAMSTMN